MRRGPYVRDARRRRRGQPRHDLPGAAARHSGRPDRRARTGHGLRPPPRPARRSGEHAGARVPTRAASDDRAGVHRIAQSADRTDHAGVGDRGDHHVRLRVRRLGFTTSGRGARNRARADAGAPEQYPDDARPRPAQRRHDRLGRHRLCGNRLPPAPTAPGAHRLAHGGRRLSPAATVRRRLGRGGGRVGETLFAAVDRAGAWIWLPFGSAPGELTAQIRDYTNAQPESLNIAMGALGSGVQGFRRSHRQAQRAREAALAAERRPQASRRVLVAATDPAVMAAALLSTGIGEVRGWVADVLGDLASATDDDAVLRETLRVFLHRGSTHEAAARELNVSFNDLRSRVERAVARRGRPIEDRAEVELALFVCHWYGSAALRPA
ncbi:hypothetical protein [Mycobacterium paragordonae]|uniref:hypothetical protein n=1 Tax=Mycobacterium paragordonae TaxID=1389713 RepID=UPI0018D40E8C